MTLTRRLRKWLGRNRSDPPDPLVWRTLIRGMPLLHGLSDIEQERLRGLVGEFVASKQFHGAEGLEIDDARRLLIAAQACLPILNLGSAWYRGWRSIIVYPDSFRVPYHETDGAGVVHEGEHVRSGESWPDGPVVLSWPDVVSGANGEYDENLVIHEFAHKLDQRDGVANGFPPLPVGMNRAAWSAAFTDAFNDLNRRLDHHQQTPFGDYEASSPAEFFAASCELFFVRPDILDAQWPSAYTQLKAFFRQDPLARQNA
ncbi:MAG: zinc-dependent peptidase [Gammaproteobacteria bacterium]|nr:zinc-dependent peptidase [Gammaproteobacteria bacterium]MCP5137940.1 zinc-dependent peptidase [Gammaproteobacteria bacterium]